jgi:hypothetical protein
LCEVFARDPRFAAIATARAPYSAASPPLPITWRFLDASTATVEDCTAAIAGADTVVNCIGITKPYSSFIRFTTGASFAALRPW